MASLPVVSEGSASMGQMTTATAAPARSAIWAAWAVLIGMGGTEMVYNIWHAIFTGHMHWGLALLYGLAPVAAAVLLSHIVAELGDGWFLRAVAFLVMLSAMSLSAYATASVTRPAAGSWFAWVFGLTLDAAALVALQVILSSRSRKNAAMEALETAGAQVHKAQSEAATARRELAEVRAELTATRERLEAEVQGLRSALNDTLTKTLNTSWHALAQAFAGHPADGGRHAGGADR